MNNILEGLRYAALGAAGFAVAAIVNPGNANAQQLTEERVLINCEQGKGPREAIWTSNRPRGATLLLGQLDWVSLGDGEWKIYGHVVAIDSLHFHDLPNSKEIYMLDPHTIIFKSHLAVARTFIESHRHLSAVGVISLFGAFGELHPLRG